MSDEFDFEDGFRQANERSGKGLHLEAETLYRLCLKQQPDHEWALNNLGYSLNQLGRFPEAIARLQQVVLQHPDNLTAHANLAAAWEGSGEKHEALNCRRRLTEIKPDSAEFHADLANLLLSLGRAAEAMHSYERSLELNVGNRATIHNYLLATNYADTLTEEEVAEIHFRWAATKSVQRRALQGQYGNDNGGVENDRSADRRLRIGYVSTDFSTHPVGKLMAGILAATKSIADNVCYFDSKTSDPWTARIRNEACEFQETVSLSDADFCSLVQRDRIDVLVDLNGHTGGRNRLGAFAMGAAPVQVSFLGYPNTTGHSAVDYYISDEFCTPTGMSDHLFCETLWRLPTGCLAFRPPEDVPLPSGQPFEKNGHFTFGSFNNPSKVSPTTLAAWAEILAEVPESRLLVKYAKAFRSGVLRERWIDGLCGGGVDPTRIRFIRDPLPYREHLATFANVDLCLDPFPYQGTMTTLESLSMGSPVLTKAGRNYCRRASLLLRLGEQQLVTGSVAEYVEAAIRFGRHPEQLSPIRKRIAGEFRHSSICDVGLLGNELIDAYRGMWQKRVESPTTLRRGFTAPLHQAARQEHNRFLSEEPGAEARRAPEASSRGALANHGAMDDGKRVSANTVWIASYPKSGNTWVRFLLTNLLRPDITSSAEVEALIPDVHKTDTHPTPTAAGVGFAKTHFLPSKLPTDYHTSAAIYVYRNPMDVLASHVNYFELRPGAVATTSFIDSFLSKSGPPRWAELGFGSWEEHVTEWCLTPKSFPVLAVSYENLHRDTPGVLKRIVDCAGIHATADDVVRACERSTAESLRQLENSEIAGGVKGFFSSERTSKSDDFRFVKSAESRRATEVLSENVVANGEAYYRSLLQALDASARS